MTLHDCTESRCNSRLAAAHRRAYLRMRESRLSKLRGKRPKMRWTR